MRALALNSQAGYPIVFERGGWSMYSQDRSQVLGRFDDLVTAKRVRDKRIARHAANSCHGPDGQFCSGGGSGAAGGPAPAKKTGEFLDDSTYAVPGGKRIVKKSGSDPDFKKNAKFKDGTTISRSPKGTVEVVKQNLNPEGTEQALKYRGRTKGGENKGTFNTVDSAQDAVDTHNVINVGSGYRSPKSKWKDVVIAPGMLAGQGLRSLKGSVGGELRTAVLEGRDQIVIPIVALVEGVLFASNADHPEFVPIDVIEESVAGWNGEPVMLNHPSMHDGSKITANSPEALDAWRIGRVFNARVEDKKLLMDVWVEEERLDKVEGARSLIEGIQGGKIGEVSIGAFVELDNKSGRHGKQDFHAVWKRVTPDHLAMLPEGTRGACNTDMGCGTRAAMEHGA